MAGTLAPPILATARGGCVSAIARSAGVPNSLRSLVQYAPSGIHHAAATAVAQDRRRRGCPHPSRICWIDGPHAPMTRSFPVSRHAGVGRSLAPQGAAPGPRRGACVLLPLWSPVYEAQWRSCTRWAACAPRKPPTRCGRRSEITTSWSRRDRRRALTAQYADSAHLDRDAVATRVRRLAGDDSARWADCRCCARMASINVAYHTGRNRAAGRPGVRVRSRPSRPGAPSAGPAANGAAGTGRQGWAGQRREALVSLGALAKASAWRLSLRGRPIRPAGASHRRPSLGCGGCRQRDPR